MSASERAEFEAVGRRAARRARLRRAILAAPRWRSTYSLVRCASAASREPLGAVGRAPFVVGVGRSGTTLLRMMLDAHPELAIPPETHFAQPPSSGPRAGSASPEIAWSRSSATTAGAGTTSASTDSQTCSPASQAIEPFNTSDALRAFYEPLRRQARASRAGVTRRRTTCAKMKKIQNDAPGGALHPRDPRRPRRRPVPEHAGDQAREGARPAAGDGSSLAQAHLIKAREDAAEIGDYLEVRYEDLIDRHRGRACGASAS